MSPRTALLVSTVALLAGGPGPRAPLVTDSPVYRAPAAARVVAPPPRELVHEQIAPRGWVVQLRLRRSGEYATPLWRVMVDGREVLAERTESIAVDHVLPTPDGELVLLEVIPGGVACEAMYRVLEMRYDHPPRISGEFGSCAAPPVVRLENGRLRIYTGYWLPYYIGLMDPQPPGVRPEPSGVYEYRDGRMVVLARGARADPYGGAP
jgi:hypothetical protein